MKFTEETPLQPDEDRNGPEPAGQQAQNAVVSSQSAAHLVPFDFGSGTVSPQALTVVEKMAIRKAEMTDMRPSGGGKTRLTFSAPSRGLIGYHGEFLSDTRGTGIMNRLFEKYGPYKGPIQGRQNGVLISMEQGAAVAYALSALEDRGVLFISPGDMLYEGMVIGEDAEMDAKRFRRSENGICLITQEMIDRLEA